MDYRREYLFLCHGGAKRSPTAVSVAYELALERKLNIIAECGAADSINELNAAYMARNLSRYEKIIVMDRDIAIKLRALSIVNSRVFCLNIPDKYEKYDTRLREILRSKLTKLIS